MSNNNYIEINIDACKGCKLCIASCNHDQIEMTGHLNSKGYNYIHFKDSGCTGCGLCYYACPEPNAIKVYKEIKKKVGSDK